MQQRRRISAVRHRPTLAILLSIALVASGLAAANSQILRTQNEGIGPVDVMNQSANFASGANIVVDDPAITAQGEEPGPRTVKEFQREEPFSMFALTWTGDRDITAFVRAEMADGSWTEWFDMEPISAESPESNGTRGTDLIFHGSTNRIQVSTLNVDLFGDDAAAAANDGAGNAIPEAAPVADYAAEPVESAPIEEPAPAIEAQVAEAPEEAAQEEVVQEAPAPAEAPAPGTGGLAPLPSNYGDIQPVAEVASDLDAVFIDGNADAGVGGVDLMADSDGMPRVISRAGWGANEASRCSNPTIDDDVSAITIHHTAGSNNYTRAESAARMRGYYNYHAVTLGWCDIGYQALVDKYGTIYEGRFGGLNRAVRGAHAGGFNQNTWAISMMGNYQNVTPPAATIQSVGELAGWRAKVAGFEPKGQDTHYSEGSSYTFYRAGQAVTLPNIFAHRNVGSTACPGDAGYAQMDAIRDIAQAKYTSIQLGASDGTTTETTTTTTTAPDTTATSTPEPADPTDPTDPTETTDPAETTDSEGAEVTVTVTAEPEPEPQPSSGSSDLDILNSVITGGSSEGSTLLNGANTSQLLTGLGSILAAIIGIAAVDGDLGDLLGNVGNLNGVPTLDNVALNDVVAVGNTVADLTGDNEYSRTWNDLNNALGPVLGAATGGATTVQYTGARNSEVSFMPFENGIMVSSPEAGTHGLWGVIGDTWAQQGADLGPLGLPLNHEYRDGNLLRVDFQGGYITFDPATAKVDIQLT
ncbi:N-acetylmuramoyl-L-alanine amidase [Corynebacterium faecale]|uniref:N-acetylmuramoyl-L-alanine amidase n=1 Tax=Corynebacterium faecale TaxID=1758466 RepID=UPI0025B40DFF|nr:N-acetylmuramoyl-L-alanine amidase [Corynebacterium faecale]WJY93331.1 N-acetylmuramoyl-L-alanine amidase [Corynebacterium faecale]